MRLVLLLGLLLTTNVLADPGVTLEILSQSERIDANRMFDDLRQKNGLIFGDIVGNGHAGDVVGNGHEGDVVGNGTPGDVVGNGGGVIEGTLQYLAKNLNVYIHQAILYADYEYPPDFMQALSEIHTSVAMREKPIELIFLSGDTAVNFFTDLHDQQIRAAKTGFSEDYAIYINIDYLYANQQISREHLLGLLVHEVGHQVGYKSHSFLDIVAAEVVRVINLKMNHLESIAIGDDFVDVQFLNYDFNGSKAHLAVSYADKTTFISGWNVEEFKPVCGHYFPIGYRYRNLAWSNYIELISGIETNKGAIEGILEVNCGGPRGGIMQKFIGVEIDIKVEETNLKVDRRFLIPQI